MDKKRKTLEEGIIESLGEDLNDLLENKKEYGIKYGSLNLTIEEINRIIEILKREVIESETPLDVIEVFPDMYSKKERNRFVENFEKYNKMLSDIETQKNICTKFKTKLSLFKLNHDYYNILKDDIDYLEVLIDMDYGDFEFIKPRIEKIKLNNTILTKFNIFEENIEF